MIGVVHLEDGHVQWPEGMDGPRRASDTAPWWTARGVQDVLLIDEDAQDGGADQWHLVPAFVRHRLHVRFVGGVRSMTQVQQLLDMGVQEVVVGTIALAEPAWLRELLILFPDRVRVHVRLEDGRLAGEDAPTAAPEALLEGLRAVGAERLLVTGEGATPWLAASEGFDVLHDGAGGRLIEAYEAPALPE